MAEAPEKPGHPLEVALLVLAVLAGLFALWWARGGPQHAGKQELFLQRPSATSTETQPGMQPAYVPPPPPPSY